MQLSYWLSDPPINCDLCEKPITNVFIDGLTVHGPWAIMCPRCHIIHGKGLGLNKGQQYQLQADGQWLKLIPQSII